MTWVASFDECESGEILLKREMTKLINGLETPVVSLLANFREQSRSLLQHTQELLRRS